MNYFPAATSLLLLLLLLFSTLTLSATAATPASPPSGSRSITGGCSDTVIAISPCLPFISDPPNCLSSRPSSQCCDLFVASFTAGEAICLCYLIHGNRLLGFPVNTTRLLSLSSLCAFKETRSNITISLQTICTGENKLPPLVSTIGPVISIPHNFDSDNASHPLNTTATSSHGQSSSSSVPAAVPTTSQQIMGNANQFPPGTIIFMTLFVCFFQPNVAALLLGNHL